MKLKIFIIFLFGITCMTLAIAQDLSVVKDKTSNWTRIVISTSGPTKFSSYWLDWPPRLVIEFQSKNIMSKMNDEIIINQGILKKITSKYFDSENRFLKSLTFQFRRKVPYKIWEENNNIILSIKIPSKIFLSSLENSEILVKSTSGNVIVKRLEAMDTALAQMGEGRLDLEVPKVKPVAEEIISPVIKGKSPRETRLMMSVVAWFLGLTIICGAGFLIWLFWHRYRLILDKNMAIKKIAKLNAELQEKDRIIEEKGKFIEQEEILRKTIENTSILREKEFEQLKLELKNQKGLLGQEKSARKKIEEELLQKQKECKEIKDSLESLKGVLVEKGFAKRLSSSEEKGGLWIPEKSTERRDFPRLDLRRDYNRTIIIRIEPPDGSKGIKTFANNISSGGLCFEARKEFTEKDRLNLRLFFFGDKVPMIKAQAKIIWKKTVFPVNYYGVSFVVLDEKGKTALNRYIETKAERS